MGFSENLKRIRSEKGLSQQELAKRVGVSQTAIYQWEKGTRTPKIEAIAKLANVLAIHPTQLFTVKEDGKQVIELNIPHMSMDNIEDYLNVILPEYMEECRKEKDLFSSIDNKNTIAIDTDVDQNHPFNIIQKKIDNGEQLTSDELAQYKEHILKALSSIRQTLESFGESLKKSFSQYYALLNDEGQKEADIQIQKAIERATERAENQAKEDAENQIKLLTRIPEYQKTPDD